MSYAVLGQVYPGGRGNSNDGSPTRGNSNDSSPTRTEVRSPTSTSTSTEVRSPTSTSTDAYTRGNVTVTGGAGEGAYTNVRVYQGLPGNYPEREGRAAGRTQEKIVSDTIRGLTASRPAGVPIPLQSGATTQKVGLRGIGSYSGLGQAAEAPIKAGAATTDGILSYASLWAASVMRQMAAVPRPQRLSKMESILNGMWPGMGSQARQNYLRFKQTRPANEADQAVFDAIRLSFANRIADFTAEQLAKRPGGMSGSGLGESVGDIRATGCMISGIVATGTSTVSMFVNSPNSALTLALAAQGGATGGCDVAAIEARGRAAALLAAATTGAGDAGMNRMIMYGGLGIGALVALAIVYKVVLK